MPGEAPPRESRTREVLRRYIMGHSEVCLVHALPLIDGVASDRILCFVESAHHLTCVQPPAVPCIAL
jgi:hypothetical protein